MEVIVLAVSGLSLLGVSSLLRKKTAKHIYSVRPNDRHTHQAFTDNVSRSDGAYEPEVLLQHQMPLLDRPTSSLLQQYANQGQR
jgi:hypothetical protein